MMGLDQVSSVLLVTIIMTQIHTLITVYMYNISINTQTHTVLITYIHVYNIRIHTHKVIM